MMVLRMRPFYRHFVTCSLLALYGGVALVGHGLHWLSSADHHHHGPKVARCATHDHAHAHGHCAHHHAHHHHPHHHDLANAGSADSEKPLHFAPSNGAAHSHECEICTFLVQLRGERPQLASTILGQHLVVVARAAMQRSYSLALLSPHAPRGPPIYLG